MPHFLKLTYDATNGRVRPKSTMALKSNSTILLLFWKDKLSPIQITRAADDRSIALAMVAKVVQDGMAPLT